MRTPKPSPVTFALVRTMGLALPDTEASTSWGSPSLKVRGTMFACMAVHKSAEPNTLAVRIDFADHVVVGQHFCSLRELGYLNQ